MANTSNTGALTQRHNIEVANLFYTCMLSTNTSYYVFAGKHTPWADDSAPPPANGSIYRSQLSVYSDILYGKKVTSADVRRLVPNHVWTSNTVYANYDPADGQLSTKQFYVITSANSVYKVLDNNGYTPSVVEPSVITTDIFKTSDGYTWKFMYNLNSSEMTKFASSGYIPVTTNTDVQAAAVSGSIDVIRVENPGQGYFTYNTGTLQSVVNAYAVTISSNSASNNNFYTNSSIYLRSGIGAGQIRKIRSYNGASKVATLTEPLNYYTTLTVSNPTGTFKEGDIVSQSISFVIPTSISGYIQPGDIVDQYIPGSANATGTVVTISNNAARIIRTSTAGFVSDRPAAILSRGTTLRTGTVTVANNSNTITGTGTAFTTEYSEGSYIKIGTSPQIFRITAVANTTQLTIAGPTQSAFTANAHYKVNSALDISSVTNIVSNGEIVFADLDTVALTISSITGAFSQGEIITQNNSSTNGVISFANSSTLIVTNVTGPGFQSSNSVVDFSVTGVTSTVTANVNLVTSTPTITLQNATNEFTLGVNVTSTSTGSAMLTSISSTPNEQTEYVISPTVNISGDGTGASAYSIVNPALGTIESIAVFSPGRDYIHPGTLYNTTTATIEANGFYGTGAVLTPVISPVGGHGFDPSVELGSSYVGVTVGFDNSLDNYEIPTTGTFRRVGLIKNPKYDDVVLQVSNYDRVKLSISNLANSKAITVGEAVYQLGTNAAGVVVYGNTSYIELEKVKGTFIDDEAGDNIYAFYSESSANVDSAIVSTFSVSSNTQVVQQEVTGATGVLVSANTTAIRLTDVQGLFTSGYKVFDTSSNSYATVTGVTINGKSMNFTKFNNTMRYTLSSNTNPFTVNEPVHLKSGILGNKLAQALVFSTNSDIDLVINSPTTSFLTSETVTQGSANAVVQYANSTYLKLTNISGTFSTTSNVVGTTSGAQSAVSSIHPVLLLSDIEGNITTSNSNFLFGTVSGSVGYSDIANTITQPQLVRDTGSVLYIENISPITKSSTSKETVKLVIKF